MKISIVIPAYNEEKLIGDCLTAISRQTIKPDEIIVVDNNCRDKTIKIAKRFKVKIVRETVQGISYARNAGFDAATGEIIGRIDADTIVEPSWVETVKAAFETPGVVGITGPAYFRKLPLERLSEIIHTAIFYHFLSKIHGHYLLYGSNMALSKKSWQKVRNRVNMDNREVHEDLDLAIYLAKIGRIKYIPALMVSVSNRRVLNLPSGTEYVWRYLKMLWRLFITHSYFK